MSSSNFSYILLKWFTNYYCFNSDKCELIIPLEIWKRKNITWLFQPLLFEKTTELWHIESSELQKAKWKLIDEVARFWIRDISGVILKFSVVFTFFSELLTSQTTILVSRV